MESTSNHHIPNHSNRFQPAGKRSSCTVQHEQMLSNPPSSWLWHEHEWKRTHPTPSTGQEEHPGQRFPMWHHSVLGMVTFPHMGLLSCLFSCWHIPRGEAGVGSEKGLFHVLLQWSRAGTAALEQEAAQTSFYLCRAIPGTPGPSAGLDRGLQHFLGQQTHKAMVLTAALFIPEECERHRKLPKTLCIRNVFLETPRNFKVHWGEKPRNVKQVIELQWKAMAGQEIPSPMDSWDAKSCLPVGS